MWEVPPFAYGPALIFATFAGMGQEMLTLLPSEMETPELHGFLLGAIGPRPIAFASTVDAAGTPNLSPFSFFNVFSANPPVLIFSPARRVRDNTEKHTLENVREVPEVVINTVSYAMVQQMSLSSTEYPRGVNEFVKAGFGMEPSRKVRPFRVSGAPAQFECEVTEIRPLGQQGGAGNLVFCQVVALHLDRAVLDAKGRPDPAKQDLVARMGGDWYSRSASGLFEVPKPLRNLGIGMDLMPEGIRSSTILTGNDLGLLGNVEALPQTEEVAAFLESAPEASALLEGGSTEKVHQAARRYLAENDVSSAWKILLAWEHR